MITPETPTLWYRPLLLEYTPKIIMVRCPYSKKTFEIRPFNFYINHNHPLLLATCFIEHFHPEIGKTIFADYFYNGHFILRFHNISLIIDRNVIREYHGKADI